jgi:hypothetical protein
MSGYTINNGFAIPLQQTLASRVTSGTASNAGVVTGFVNTARTATFNDQVDFVLTGTPDIAALRSKIASPIKQAFVDQTVAHETAISSEYRKDLREIPASHPVEARPRAQQHMARIVGQVATSLGESNRRTRALFDGVV